MYIKAVIYGKNLDLYEYERRTAHVKRLGVPTSTIRLPYLVVGTGDTVQSTEESEILSKRRSSIRRGEVAFRRLVLSNIRESSIPALITCTYAENQSDIGKGIQDFKTFIRDMRRQFGTSFSYIAVHEFQKRGAVHFHTLFWGLPSKLCEEERHTRLVASLWGHGFVDTYLTDNSEKLASYLAKYMTKSFLDPRLFGRQVYLCSRNIIRPLEEKNLGGLWYLQERYGIGGDNPPCVDKSFETQWLGKGRFRAYKIKSITT